MSILPQDALLSNTLNIRRATSQQWISATISGSISALLMAWVARTIGPAEFALFGATLNAALIALVVTDGGWSTLMYRELSRPQAHSGVERLPGAALAYAVVAFIPCTVAVVVLTPSSVAAVSAMLCMFVVALMNHRSSRMRAAQNFAGDAVWQLSGRIVSAITIVFALTFFVNDNVRSDVTAATWVFLAWALGLTVCLLVTAPVWWRRPNWEGMRAMRPLALSLLTLELGAALLTRGDLVLLSTLNRWCDFQAPPDIFVGYSASARFMEVVLLFVAPLSNVVIAYLRGDEAKSSTRSRRMALVAALILWAVGWVLWLGGLASSARLFAIAFGAAYESGSQWLKWASLPLPWMMANLVLLQASIALAAPQTIALYVVCCALFFLLLSTVMLYSIGANGVAVGATVSQALLTLLLVCSLFPQQKSLESLR